MSSKGLILLTGVNGFICGRTAEAFLKAGYSVRGTVRSRASARATVDALAQYGDRLEVVEVPDISVPGAFDEAVKGVVGIAHLSQQVNFEAPNPENILEQVSETTKGILESATKAASVKTVILMSSSGAVLSIKEGPYTFTEKDWNDSAVEATKAMGAKAPAWYIYLASKVVGERAFWEFREEQKPSFTMTAVNPVYVVGPPLTTPESPDKIPSTIRHIWNMMKGGDIVGMMPGMDWFVDVRDVAKMVVWGVEHADEADGERYIVKTAWAPPQATVDTLRPAYPHLSIKEGQPGEGYLPGWETPLDTHIDGSKALRVIGSDHVPYGQSVLDTAKTFEQLLSKE